MNDYVRCGCCNQPLDIIEYPPIVPGKPAIVSVTCWNCVSPAVTGRTLSPAEHKSLCQTINAKKVSVK